MAYSFRDTILLVNGEQIVGFDNGDDIISFQRNEKSVKYVVGGDGRMSPYLGSDRTGTIEFKLLQNSESNKYLYELSRAQESGEFAPVFVQFTDYSQLDLVSGTQGFIESPAPVRRGEAPNAHEWVIVVERLDILEL